MAKPVSYLIIGNGIAGVTAAETLRAKDTVGSISIIADDPFPVYYRPALKDYLGGRVREEQLWARPSTFYQEQHVRFIPGRVTGINAAQGFVQLHNGQQIGYYKLLLASGARPRQLSCPGLELTGVKTLRSVLDYQQVVQRLERTRRVVVCGSGTLALESAESLNHLGYQVTHLLRNRILWSEVLDSTASDMVLQEERRAGIDVRVEEEIAEIVGRDGQVCEVITTSGAHLPCEQVLIAIGVDPIIDYISSSGIACGRGVIVDELMRTSLPDIYAAGDLLEVTDEMTGRTRVLGQWYPAVQQARSAAQSMLGQLDARAPFHPGALYNASFLHGLDFAAVGASTHLPQQPLYHEIIAEPQPRRYQKIALYGGIPVGTLLLGDRKGAQALKRAIDHKADLSPVLEHIFASDFDLDHWLDQQGVPAPILPTNRQVEERSKTGKVTSGKLLPVLRGTRPLAPPQPMLVPIPHPAVSEPFSEIALPRDGSIGIGRQPGSALVLDHRTVSRQHAEISAANGQFNLRDAGSTYGTFVNQTRLSDRSIHTLQDGDAVRFGDVQFRFTHGSTEAEALVVGLEHREETRGMKSELVRFEIDMCIGCNRCMEACPVPISSLVSIADLNHANVTETALPHVEDFTHECIMCGSCVPVCPVDNHRDLLMLALKQRMGVSWDMPVDPQRLMRQLPPGWSVPLLITLLREQAMFQDEERVPELHLLHLFSASRLLTLAPGSAVLSEGEYGRDLYLILQGRLSLFSTTLEGAQLELAVLDRGEFVGEYGMLTGQPYAMSARAQTPTLILQVPEQVMRRLMELAPEVRQFFDRLNNGRSLPAIFKRMALFQGISDAEIQWLAGQTQVKPYGRDEALFAEDDQPQGSQGKRPARETLHIVLEGFVKVARHAYREERGQVLMGERIIAYRQAGDYFAGGLDLLGDGRAVSVTAINRVRVAEVPRDALHALLQRYPEVNQRFAQRLKEYIDSTASAHTGSFSIAALKGAEQTGLLAHPMLKSGLHALVKDGVVEGTEVLVIDLDKCIHCNECEEACARRHGQSRMNRKGMVVGNISVATACRQCQDPVCLLCSRAGIARMPNGEVYITESCIGCGICAERCPYGAINIVNVEEQQEERSTLQRFGEIFTKGAGKEYGRRSLPMAQGKPVGRDSKRAAPGPLTLSQLVEGGEDARKKIAIKCDLCAGYSNQACVQACPVGAAMRIQPTSFFGTTEDILQHAL